MALDVVNCPILKCELVDALRDSQLNKVLALLSWGGVINDIVVFHQNISKVPGVLLDLLRLENAKIAL